MNNRFNIFVDDHSVPLDIFLHLPNYRTQEICKIIPTNLVLAASDLCPRTLFISVPECDIGHGDFVINEYKIKMLCCKENLDYSIDAPGQRLKVSAAY